MTHWVRLGFGIYAGRTLPIVILTNPDWFYSALENRQFRSTALSDQAAELDRKAKAIRIPRKNPEEWRVEYLFDVDGRFSSVEIVPVTQSTGADGGTIVRCEHFDLSLIRQRQRHDTLGYGLLMRSFMSIYFGSINARLTQQQCEEFFDNRLNFDA